MDYDQEMNRAPLFVAVFVLLLPLFYVASYLALVVPGGWSIPNAMASRDYPTHFHYRCGGAVADRLFWPLEKVDQWLRPNAWWDDIGGPGAVSGFDGSASVLVTDEATYEANLAREAAEAEAAAAPEAESVRESSTALPRDATEQP